MSRVVKEQQNNTSAQVIVYYRKYQHWGGTSKTITFSSDFLFQILIYSKEILQLHAE